MTKLEKIRDLLTEAQSQSDEFYRKDNMKASVRYRRLLGEIKEITQQLRMDVLERKKQISVSRANKPV
ncbi:ribosomal 30S subunit maturation factor RimM [Pedobacter sp. UYEF25]